MSTVSAVPVPRPQRGAVQVLSALRRPKVAVMLALGFSSGLPFMLIGNTVGLWLAADGVGLAAIGFVSWAGMPYLVKFLWGAAVDRLPPPLVAGLGRRRGWMAACQVLVGAGLAGMALSRPGQGLALMAVSAVLTGIAAATQDTVVDAWRIESAVDPDELGLLTAAYTLGYRAALIATEAVILLVANALGWPAAYGIYAGLMLVGLIATLFAREPERADQAMKAREGTPGGAAAAFVDAVIGPFVAFFRARGAMLAILMLAMITFYHLGDYLRGPMSNPYYKALGIDLATIAGVRLTIGLAGSLAGIALGGLASLRLGSMPTLMIGAVIQPLAIAAFAALGWAGGDFILVAAGGIRISAFGAIMAFDAFAIGFSGVALVTWMSSLTTLGYTATQYAVLTSAMAFIGKTLKGFSGIMVEHLHVHRTLLEAYAEFFLLAAAVGLPAVVLTLILALGTGRARPCAA